MAKLLVVDDSPVDRKLAGALLEKQSGWNILYATDGREAIELLEQQGVDVVITDMQMPRMNGLELVETINQSRMGVATVLMTARGSEEIAVAALEKGASSYVPKRRLAMDLVTTVQRVLLTSREQRSYSTLLTHQQELILKFVLPNDLSMVLSLTAYLLDHLHGIWHLEPADRMQISTALEEALVNALHHGNLELDSELREEDYDMYYQLAEQRCGMEPYCHRKLFIDVEFDPQNARFVIRDEGKGFDPHKLPDPTDPLNIERPYGRGLLLMQTFMNHVEYNETGNQVTLVKQRKSPGHEV